MSKFVDTGKNFILYLDEDDKLAKTEKSLVDTAPHGPVLISQLPIEQVGEIVHLKRLAGPDARKPKPSKDDFGNETDIVVGVYDEDKITWKFPNLIMLGMGSSLHERGKDIPQTVFQQINDLAEGAFFSYWRDIYYSQKHQCWLIVEHTKTVKAEWLVGRTAE